MYKEKMILLGVLLVAFAAASVVPVMADPAGATNTTQITVTGPYPSSNPGTVNVSAGYIYKADVSGEQSTYHWAGVYGLASGKLVLGDSASPSHKMYEWPAKATYVFFSNATTTPGWTSLQPESDCTKFPSYVTASGVSDSCTATFNETGTPSFKSLSFSGSTIYAMTFDNTPQRFWKTYAISDGSNLIFAAETAEIIAGEETHAAFDGTSVNYQAILPENGEKGDTSATTYHIWIELY